jgi:hypothetical protein
VVLYTIYLRKDDGSIHEIRSILFEDDAAAIDYCGDVDHPHSIDVWYGGRQVARFPPRRRWSSRNPT